jgi:nicotinamide mononucleotide transporter
VPQLNWLEVWGFVTGAACVWLQVKENAWNWPLGIINNILYVVVFYRSGLFADTGLQVVFIIISIYGWWAWLRGGEHHTHLRVSRTSPTQGTVLMLLTTATTVVIWWLLRAYTPSTVPWGDSIVTSLSIVATYMLGRKMLENWIIWNVANVISMTLYIYKHLYLTTVLYAVFFAMCTAGFIRWRKELQSEARAAAAAV